MAEGSLYLLKDYEVDFLTCMCNMYLLIFCLRAIDGCSISFSSVSFVFLSPTSFVISSSVFQWSASIHMDLKGLDLPHFKRMSKKIIACNNGFRGYFVAIVYPHTISVLQLTVVKNEW